MGFDNPYLPQCTAPVLSGDRALWDVLNEMGLLEWQGQLNGVGLTTLQAFKMVEEGDLPEGIPKLVRKQIERRAAELRSSKEITAAHHHQHHSQPITSAAITFTVKVISEERSFPLTAYPTETMGAVRARLPPCVPRPHKINFNSLPVEDYTMLCDANIVEGSQLFLIPTKTGPVSMYVKTADGAVVSVTCSLQDTVANLKTAVAREKNCRPSEICLSYKNHELFTPSTVLFELGCHEGSVFILN